MRLILKVQRNYIHKARIPKGQRIQNPNTRTNISRPKSFTNSKQGRKQPKQQLKKSGKGKKKVSQKTVTMKEVIYEKIE